MQQYYLAQRQGLTTIEFPLFNETGLVIHGITTRMGGQSLPPRDGLNLAFHVGDDPRAVAANRALMSQACGVAVGSLVAGEQVHGTEIALIGPGDAGKGALEMDTALPATDGLLTTAGGILLTAYFADCVPVLLLDPLTPAAGVVHAGWKGTAENIVSAAVKKLQKSFGTDPCHLLAAIGPSIGPCCFKVDGNVADIFGRRFSWFDRVYHQSNTCGQGTIDLWETNRRQLVEMGLQDKNIAVAGLCTCCRQDLFFSYRGSGGQTGRIAAFIMLK